MTRKYTQITFTDSVKEAQVHYGARQAGKQVEAWDMDDESLSGAEQEFIAERDGFYLATVNEDGWPYVQFRGGPTGFLKVLDRSTLGYADFRGNRQYISVGNINATGRAALFLIDYPTRSRLKIWAQAEVRELTDGGELAEKLTAAGGEAVVERLLVFRIQACQFSEVKGIKAQLNVMKSIFCKRLHRIVGNAGNIIERFIPEFLKLTQE